MLMSCKVLSVKTSVERRKKITAQLEAAKMPEWSFFDALDKDNLEINFDYSAFRNEYRREPLFGEISCLASHIKIIKDFIKSDATTLLVFEDDLAIDPYFKFELAMQLMEMCKIPYLKLFARYFVPAKYINSFGRFTIYRANWPPLGTQAFALSKEGAQKFIDYINKFEKIYKPIDNLLDNFEDHKIPAYLLYPFPIMELTFPTSIFTQPLQQLDVKSKNEGYIEKTITKINKYIKKAKIEKEFVVLDNKIKNTIENQKETFMKLH